MGALKSAADKADHASPVLRPRGSKMQHLKLDSDKNATSDDSDNPDTGADTGSDADNNSTASFILPWAEKVAEGSVFVLGKKNDHGEEKKEEDSVCRSSTSSSSSNCTTALEDGDPFLASRSHNSTTTSSSSSNPINSTLPDDARPPPHIYSTHGLSRRITRVLIPQLRDRLEADLAIAEFTMVLGGVMILIAFLGIWLGYRAFCGRLKCIVENRFPGKVFCARTGPALYFAGILVLVFANFLF